MKALICGLSAFLVIGAATASRAIDLRNEDQREYQVQITSSSMTRDINLNGRTLSLVVCVGECEFYVEGVGRTKARGNDTVTIRDGRIINETKH